MPRGRIALGLIFVFLITYGWFFQGGGWNQNSRFDVVRALVEQHTLAITAFAANTGDVSHQGAEVYSSKPPGPSVLAAPLYAAARTVERASGIEPASPYAQTGNAHLVTWAVAGVPAALLVALLFLYLAEVTGDERQALSMAAAFGAGSLALPYSGVLMNHLLVAFGLFAAWLALEAGRPTRSGLIGGGAALGVALFSEYLTLPLIALYALVWWHRRPELGRDAALFWVGPALGVAALLGLQLVMFGSPFTLTYDNQNPAFVDQGLAFGMVGVPDPRRIWWLTLQPYRGLFWSSPMLALAVLGPGRIHGRRRAAFCLAMVGYFLLFNLAFKNWPGGWGFGPRYLIPALPFLFVLTADAWKRFALARSVAVALSVVFMLAAATTLVMVPGPDGGGPPPPGRDPVLETLELAAGGAVSVNPQAIFENLPGPSRDPAVDDRWDSYNVGELLGLEGIWSVLPVVLLMAGGVLALGRAAKRTS